MSPFSGYFVGQMKVLRKNRYYGGTLVLIKSSAFGGYEKMNNRSENLGWFRIVFFVFFNMGSN